MWNQQRYCITCGKSINNQIVKPTWSLAWGLLWRIWVISIPIVILLQYVNRVLGV